MTVTLIADDGAGTEYTLIDAASPWKLTAANWGNAVWDTQFTGPRGSLGPRAAASTVGNRQVALGLRLLPASVDAGAGHQKDLNAQINLMHRAGGRIRVEHTGQSYRQYLVVTAGSAGLQDWTNRSEFAGRVDYALTFVCDPYVHGDSMEVVDGFATDTLTGGDWGTVPAGFTVAGGVMTVAHPTNAVVLHDAWGYRHGDVQVAATFTWGTVTGQWSTVVFKAQDSSNYLYAGVYDDGGTSTLYLGAVVAGVDTGFTSQALGARVTAGMPFRVVGRVEGNRVTGTYYPNATYAEFHSGGTSTGVYTMTGTPLSMFGHGVTGRCGINVATADDVVADDFVAKPFTYLSLASAGMTEFAGTIPGDAPALIETEVLIGDGSATPRFAAVGLTRVADRNYVEGGDFEGMTVGSAPSYPWKVTAETGVTGAATSITVRSTAAKYGSQCGEIVCPATANTGASRAIQGPFHAGRTYTLSMWVRAASATTNTRIRLGVNGDISSSTATALTSTWTERTVTWTPTLDYLVAYVAAEVTAATATTWQIDAVQVTEEAPTLPSQQLGRGATHPIGVLLADTSSYGSPTPTTVAASWPYLTTKTLRADTGVDTQVVGQWFVDPSLVDPDPHTGLVAVEIWAYIITPGALTNGYARAGSGGDSTQWTQEYGSTGVPLGTSSSNLYRLGTVQMNASTDARQGLVVQLYWTGGTGNIELAWALLLPAHRRFSWPTGKSTTGYPNLGSASVAVLKRLAADGGGLSRRRATGGGYTLSTGHGHILTAEPGANLAAWAFTTAVPSTTASAATAQPPLRLSFIPTPRWHQLRDE